VDRHDVDGGAVILTSPLFGADGLLSLDLAFDRWYYTPAFLYDSFRAEVSTDDGANWQELEDIALNVGAWETRRYRLVPFLEPTPAMRLRFTVQDGGPNTTVEGAIDEVRAEGVRVDCESYTPPLRQAPNGVGETLHAMKTGRAHVHLSWQASPVDPTHDAATLYRIERSTTPGGGFLEVGSSPSTEWVDVDALASPETFYYLVRAENSGGTSAD
jgi:hypothetical protein